MPIHEIRESLEQSNVTFDNTGFAIVQKVINLKPNMSHKMLQCDAFLDNPFPELDGTAYFELLITPTPVTVIDNSLDIICTVWIDDNEIVDGQINGPESLKEYLQELNNGY